MTVPKENPFELYGLDPREGIGAITQRLKELAEDAKDDAERERIRQAWEELTLHPTRRLRAALFAHPDTRGPIGNPPPRKRPAAQASELRLRDLAPRPSVSLAIPDAGTQGDEVAPSLEDDPVLRDGP